jgi:hypothetical protein
MLEGTMSDWAPITAVATIIGWLLIIIGWGIVHRLAVNRDRRNRQAEMAIAYLADAFEKIALYANRRPEDLRQEDLATFVRMLESAVAKIHLFGTPRQISILNKALDEWDKSAITGRPQMQVDPLLSALRNDLRRRLSLPFINTPLRWIRPLGGAVPQSTHPVVAANEKQAIEVADQAVRDLARTTKPASS